MNNFQKYNPTHISNPKATLTNPYKFYATLHWRLRSLVVRASEWYSKDPGSSPGGDVGMHVFHTNSTVVRLKSLETIQF